MQTNYMTTPTPRPYGETSNASVLATIQDANTQSSEISAFVGDYKTLGSAGIKAADHARKDFLNFQSGIQQFGTQAGNTAAYRPVETAVSYSKIREFRASPTQHSPDIKLMIAFAGLLLKLASSGQANADAEAWRTEAAPPKTHNIHPDWKQFEVMNRAYQCSCGG
jgi:hypothetical protein